MSGFKIGDKVRIVGFGHDNSEGEMGLGFPSSVMGEEGEIIELAPNDEGEEVLVSGPGISFNSPWGRHTAWGTYAHLIKV